MLAADPVELWLKSEGANDNEGFVCSCRDRILDGGIRPKRTARGWQ
jgi:hypothetical protein